MEKNVTSILISSFVSESVNAPPLRPVLNFFVKIQTKKEYLCRHFFPTAFNCDGRFGAELLRYFSSDSTSRYVLFLFFILGLNSCTAPFTRFRTNVRVPRKLTFHVVFTCTLMDNIIKSSPETVYTIGTLIVLRSVRLDNRLHKRKVNKGRQRVLNDKFTVLSINRRKFKYLLFNCVHSSRCRRRSSYA